MKLDSSTMLTFILLFIVLYQIYSVMDTNNKIWCTFRRADRTKVSKWAKSTQARIEFDGGWYQVEPGRVTLAIKWNPLPMWVRTLDLRHDSSRALDPDTFDNQYTPEARKQLDAGDDIRALEQGNANALTAGKGMKLGILQQYMPLVMVAGFLILGYLVYQQGHRVDMLGVGQNFIEGQLQELLKR